MNLLSGSSTSISPFIFISRIICTVLCGIDYSRGEAARKDAKMIFLGKKLFNASFDEFARSYHNIRPGYPLQMYKDIRTVCKIDKCSRLLEIGAGSGNATKHLAHWGCEITAIEPGQNLLKIAREEIAGFPNVRFVNDIFESFESEAPFDILFSATAFHWINPNEKYVKTDALLKNDGYLILAWNSFCQSDSNAAAAIDNIYKVTFPDKKNSGDPNLRTLSRISAREQEILSTGMFFFVFLQRYITHFEYKPDDYALLMNTFPNVINLNQKKRKTFLQKISETVAQYGTITVPILTNLYICKKVGDFSRLIMNL